MSEEAVENFHGDPLTLPDWGMCMNMTCTNGGVYDMGVDLTGEGAKKSAGIAKLTNDFEGFYGWIGMGGSILQWNPEMNISFAYAPSTMLDSDMLNSRGSRMQGLVKECVRKMRETTQYEAPSHMINQSIN